MTSTDARLPCTNREVQSDLNDTEIGMALAQGGTNDWRVLVFLSAWAVQSDLVFFF